MACAPWLRRLLFYNIHNVTVYFGGSLFALTSCNFTLQWSFNKNGRVLKIIGQAENLASFVKNNIGNHTVGIFRQPLHFAFWVTHMKTPVLANRYDLHNIPVLVFIPVEHGPEQGFDSLQAGYPCCRGIHKVLLSVNQPATLQASLEAISSIKFTILSCMSVINVVGKITDW